MYTKKIQDYATTRLLVLSSILFCLAGCQEELSEPDTVALPNGKSGMLSLSQLTEQDLQLVTFAQSLAKSLEDVAIRRYVKEQSLLNIDGENDMLYELIKSEQVGDRSFSNHLAAHLPQQNIPTNTRQDADAFFNKHFEAMPLLSLGVAVHLDAWDAEKFVPLVAVELSDHSEQAPYVRAYDSKGELHLLTLEEAPEDPTVVVRMNERLESLGHKAGKLMYQASRFMPKTRNFHRALRQFDNHILSRIDYSEVTNAISAQFCEDPIDGPGGDTPIDTGCDDPPVDTDPPPASCNNRDCKPGNDIIYSIKFQSDSAFKKYESWTDRTLELYVLVFAEDIPLNPTRREFFEHYNKFQDCSTFGGCDAEEYIANRSLQFEWRPSNQYIGFRWMEQDGGGTTSVSFSYKVCDTCPSQSISYSEKDEDDRIGDYLVEYTDKFYTRHTLDNADLTFKLRR